MSALKLCLLSRDPRGTEKLSHGGGALRRVIYGIVLLDYILFIEHTRMLERTMPEKGELLDMERGNQQPSLPPNLQEFEVIYEKQPSFLTRCRGSLYDKWTIAAMFFDLICAGYQAVDSYANIYPGSKFAANILLNNSTWKAWEAFYWIFVICATVCNIMLLFTDWYKRLWRLGQKLRSGCLICIWFGLLPLLTFLALSGAIWMTYLIRSLWKGNAWNNACQGWDITAVVTGVKTLPGNYSFPLLATATVSAAQGSFTLRLLRQNTNYQQFTLAVYSSYPKMQFLPTYSNISYNTLDLSYSASNISASYIYSPNLAFPSLSLKLRDPSIPFTRPDRKDYPPSADLIRQNGSAISNILQTVMTSPADCITLKVCGSRQYLAEFQVALGVVMIEQFKTGMYCTLTNNKAPPNL